MSERYNPKKLIRERIASGEPPMSAQDAVDAHQKYLRSREKAKRIGGFPVLCIHNVPWTICDRCSRAVRR